jgi:hypothetical protein
MPAALQRLFSKAKITAFHHGLICITDGPLAPFRAFRSS